MRGLRNVGPELLGLTILAIAALTLTGCDVDTSPSADEMAARETRQLSTQAESEIGLPRVSTFQEMRWVNMLYELRDQAEFATYTYIVDMNGNTHLLCESIGYGIPYSLQRSNPERVYHGSGTNGRSAAFIPQPEPNGLFPPDGLDATFVLCADQTGDGVIDPVYSEPELLVTPFPLEETAP